MDLGECKASLVYKVGSRQVGLHNRDPESINQSIKIKKSKSLISTREGLGERRMDTEAGNKDP